MRLLRACLLLMIAVLPLAGGCTQRLAVEGQSDRLYAEAKGALESEGFRPVGRTSDLAGATGSDPRTGRLQFAYYADALAPTIVEIQIEPGSADMVRRLGSQAPAVAASDGPGAAPGAVPASPAPVDAHSPKAYEPGLVGAHRVVIRTWSSLTYAPDPFIADLAMGVLRRAYLLSGNVR